MADAPDKPLVCLYRCKNCGVRLFEKDASGHLLRHGIDNLDDWKKYFVRGPKNQPARPGTDFKPLNYRKRAHRSPNPGIRI